MVARLLSSSRVLTHSRDGGGSTATKMGSSFEKNVAKINNSSSSGDNGQFCASLKNNGNGSFEAFMANLTAREAALRASMAEAKATHEANDLHKTAAHSALCG